MKISLSKEITKGQTLYYLLFYETVRESIFPDAVKRGGNVMYLSDLIAGGMSSEAAVELLLNIVWTCLGAFLVFFMQAGFALVETGFYESEERRKYNHEKPDGFRIGKYLFLYHRFCNYVR